MKCEDLIDTLFKSALCIFSKLQTSYPSFQKPASNCLIILNKEDFKFNLQWTNTPNKIILLAQIF